MELIHTYKEYLELTRQYTGKGTYFNCYYMRAYLEKAIEQGKISIQPDNDNLYMYENEDIFSRVYYWINSIDSITKLDSEKQLVIEYPYSNNNINAKDMEIINKLGFVLGRESSQMSVKTENVIYLEENKDINLRFDFARKDDADVLKEILYATFNPLYAFLPDEEKMNELIHNENLIVAYYQNEIAGVLNVEIEKKVAWMRHLALHEKYHGKGIGRKLFNEGHLVWKDKVTNYKCWVDIYNNASVKMHEQMGYKFDSRKANEYILK